MAGRLQQQIPALANHHRSFGTIVTDQLDDQMNFLEELADRTTGEGGTANDDARKAILQKQFDAVKQCERLKRTVDDELAALASLQTMMTSGNQMPYGEYYAMKKKELGEKWDDNKILLSKSVRKAVGIMESADLADEAMQEAESALLDEDGLLMSQVEESFLDPFTRTEMKEPVKSKLCGHNYDSATIRQYMRVTKHKRSGLPCPVPGCPQKKMFEKDLAPNPELKKKIADSHKRDKSKRKRTQHEEEEIEVL